jgi:hypothetical protein
MKKQGKMPITGSRTQMQPKSIVKTETSRDAEKQIKQPPAPFANKNNIKNLPVGTDLTNSKNGPTVAVGAKGLPPGAPVGQTKPISMSGQVFGRMGISHPRKVGSQNLGKSKKGAAFYGE